MKNRYRKLINIGRVPICITSKYSFEKIYFREGIQRFFSSFRKPQVTIDVFYDRMPRITLRKKNLLFEIKELWSLYEIERKYIFVHKAINARKNNLPLKFAFIRDHIFRFPANFALDIKYLKQELPLPYRISIFERDFKKGKIYVKSSTRRSGLLPCPLGHSVLESILYGVLYYYDQGIVLHSCGVKDRNQGYLFVGPEEAGKSTIGKLWQHRATILHDDRVIIRKIGSDFWLFPTAWYGTIGPASSQPVKLKKIFFIHHGLRNDISRLSFAESLSKLLTQAQTDIPIWFSWYKKAILFNFTFCMYMAKKIPCYSLGFFPDKRIVDFIKSEQQ